MKTGIYALPQGLWTEALQNWFYKLLKIGELNVQDDMKFHDFYILQNLFHVCVWQNTCLEKHSFLDSLKQLQ